MWQLHDGWTENYRTALGNVVLGRIVSITSARTATLDIRIRGVPESKATTDIARMQEDLTTIDKILAFPEIEDRKLTRVTGLGNYNPYKGPKRVLFNTESGISKELILNDIKAEWLTWASDLYQPRTIEETQKKGNGCGKTRRQLTSKGFDPKTIRLQNLMLEVLLWKMGVHCRKWRKLKLDKRASTGDYKQWRC